MDEIDRISDLPVEIIHHIMSFLPLLDVIQVSVLSRRFNFLWRTSPVIEFDQELFLEKKWWSLYRVDKEFVEKLPRFSNYMDDFLRRRGPDIFLEKFKLRTFCISNIDRYIDFALANRVQEVDIKSDMEQSYYFFHTTSTIKSDIFAAKSIRVLKLTGLDLGLQNLILIDSLIKELSLDFCIVPQTIRVLSNKLLSLELRYCSTLRNIEIDVPNLQSFAYDGGYEPCEINLRAFESLKSLSLTDAFITDSWIEENVSKFISLENLSIGRCKNLRKVKIPHRQLKIFEFLSSEIDVELGLELITPNLVSFSYTGSMLPLLTIITSTQFEARLSLTRIPATIGWFLALRHLLVSFDQCKVLTIAFEWPVYFPEELKDKWVAPMFGLKHLRVEIYPGSPRYKDTVALLLQLSPRPNTLSIVQRSYYQDPVERVIKFKYVKKVEEEDSSCCKRLPVKCWRHYLTRITMENFEDVDDRESLIMFFKDNMMKTSKVRFGAQ